MTEKRDVTIDDFDEDEHDKFVAVMIQEIICLIAVLGGLTGSETMAKGMLVVLVLKNLLMFIGRVVYWRRKGRDNK